MESLPRDRPNLLQKVLDSDAGEKASNWRQRLHLVNERPMVRSFGIEGQVR